MNRKFNPVIVVGAVLLVAGVVVLAVLAGRGGSSSSTLKVLVASKDVTIGTPATSAALQVQDVKKGDVPAGAVSNLAQITGQVALGKVLAGTVITTNTFGVAGATTSTGVSLPNGKEAVGLELAFAPGALRYVIPGNRINIYMTPKVTTTTTTTAAGTPTPAQVLLKDVLVLRTTPGTGTGDGQPSTPGPGTLDFLLALSSGDAKTLIGAEGQTVNLFVSLSNTSTS